MKTKFFKKGIAITVLSIMGITALAQNKQGSKYQSSDHFGSNEYLYVDDDSSVNPVQTMISYCHGRDKYDFTLAGDKVIELYVNNRKIPADSFYVYSGLVNRLKEQIKKDRAQAAEDRKQADLDRQQAVKDQAQAEDDRAQAEKDRQQAELDRQEAEKDRQQAVQDGKQADRDRMQADEDRKQADLDRQQAVKDRAQAEEDRKQAELDRQQAEEDRKTIDSLLSDLVSYHIVPDRKSVRNVDLSDDGLYVNGKEQPADIAKKFREKYLKKPGYSLSYGGYTSGYGIHYINN
ncbi:MAG TPA: cell envelope integrity protein TolA [Chitinophagaceae bacterium]|nr:cell envelope integrity protein TolA [Chitinophagaceae bacterium]